MKKVIPFSKVQVIAICFSLLVFGSGVVMTAIHGDFNWGIDFSGGITQRIAFAPVAMTLTYNGAGKTDVIVQNKALTFSILDEGKKEDFTFKFINYKTINELALDAGKVKNISISVIDGYANAAPDRLLTLEYSVQLVTGTKHNLNIALASETEIFATQSKVETALAELGRISIQAAGAPINQEFVIKVHLNTVVKDIKKATDEDLKAIQDKTEARISELLTKTLPAETIIVKNKDFIGPTFSKELMQSAILSIIAAVILILVYVAIRFKFFSGLGGVIALIHDCAILIVFMGAFQIEISSTTVAALLTLIGYSINDTIVVYDRIRENEGLMRGQPIELIIDTSITQSLSRTIITSGATMLSVVAIAIFTTGVVKDFAVNLIVGIIFGTYSSIFIASPIAMNLTKWSQKRKSERANLKPAKAEAGKTK